MTHIPTVYLTRMKDMIPTCWKEVDRFRAMRGKGLPNWPPYCFLPLAGAYAILSRGDSLSPEECGAIAAFGALAAWRATQGIYEIHPAMRAAVETTPIGAIPVEVLHRMPEWCIYIRTPGNSYLGEKVEGFFAFLEYDANTGSEELRIVIDCPPCLLSVLSIHLDQGGLELGVAAAYAECRKQAHKAGMDFERAIRIMGVGPSELAALLTPYVNLVLYVSAENAEICDASNTRTRPEKPRPTRTKKGLRLFPPDHPTTWDVGMRLGAALQAAEVDDDSEPRGGTHAGPRPHIRRAHWHHYWSGPKSAQEISLRWLAPIAVNVDDTHPLVPTVRPIPGDIEAPTRKDPP